MISMKKSIKNTIALLIVSTLLVAGVMVAGCTQNNGSAASQSSGDQAAPALTSPVAAGDTGQQTPSYGAAPAGSSRQHPGGNFLSNTTRLTAAAATLGVSEQDLRNALNSSTTGRQNLTVAAQQLGVTSDQLAAALGIPAGGQGMRGGRNATAVQTSST
jgi:hypothetical protein